MTFSTIQNTFVSGEISPSLYGRTDLAKWHNGASTMRNFFVNYKGGASSRPGLAYVGMCKQGAPNIGTSSANTGFPRDIAFQFNINQGFVLEFGDQYMRVKYRGAYITESAKTVTSVSSAGLFTTSSVHGYSVGDWIYDTGNAGFSGLTWVVKTVPTTTTFTVEDLFGNVISAATASTSGTVSRIYTVAAPYAAVDLPYLKYAQSQDTMSLTCINQQTLTEYQPYDLQRLSDTNWVFTALTFTASVSPPSGVAVTAHNSTTADTYYSYVVTAVAANGEESIASSIVTAHNNDIAVYAGSNSLTWSAATDAQSYNIYAATPVYSTTTPTGVPYGYLGTTTGLAFTDTNITADFTRTPPIHYNPFPGAGDYPSVVSYYQQRRIYANTLNQPNTYFASRPGAFLNFDYSVPVVANDSFSGAPWAQQLNGIQFMQPTTSGLLMLTGNGAWLLNGGSQGASLNASSQTANSQAYNGCNAVVPPVVINYNNLYVQSKGSIIRDLSYNFYANVFTGTDATVLSNHLFSYYKIQQWAYAEEPFKIVWCMRDDGTLLSLTYLKEQEVMGWARHDTNGLFVSVCSVIEPPIDAVYTIVKRYVNGVWVYYAERMDNRNWNNVENCFCVDAGITYQGAFPNATLTPAAANGTNNITSTIFIAGGSNYTAPVIDVVDPTGQGSGATFSATLSGGVITAINVVTSGQNYQPGSTLVITDSTGSGAVAQPVVTNNVTFTASSGVFNSGMVGSVIRIGNNNGTLSTGQVITNGGGQAIITSYVSSTQVIANITQPIADTVPDDPNNTPIPAVSGYWSVSAPISTVTNLNHLEGLTVSILADGGVLPQQVVTNGQITLQQSVSLIHVGLPFTAQLQTLYLDPGQPTVQGKRKNIYNVSVRCEATRGIQVGTNQPDQSTQPNNATVPWYGMQEVKERNALITAGSAIPLFTGDFYINLPASWDVKGQVAVQQTYPLPANVLAMITNFQIGDTSA